MSGLPERCEPCEGGVTPLTLAEAEAHMADVRGWTLDYPVLRRVDELEDFRAALAWINRVGMLAEEQGHHPDVHLTGWNRVELVLSTHSIGGLSINDFVLARLVDGLSRPRR